MESVELYEDDCGNWIAVVLEHVMGQFAPIMGVAVPKDSDIPLREAVSGLKSGDLPIECSIVGHFAAEKLRLSMEPVAVMTEGEAPAIFGGDYVRAYAETV